MSTQQSKPSIFIVFLLYLPLIWIATGIIWVSQGDKELVPFVLVSAFTSLYYFKFDVLRQNWHHSQWGKGLFACSIFATISYLTHGFGSQELRGLIIGLVFFLTFPRQVLHSKLLQWLLLLAAINALCLSVYFGIIEPTDRVAWPTNAVPLAHYQGLLAIIATSALLTKFTSKNHLLLILATTLSITAALLTQSRGVIVSLVMIYGLIGFWALFCQKITVRTSVITAVAGLIVLLFSWPTLSSRLQVTEAEFNSIQRGNLDTSIGLRLQMYQEGVALFLEKPILGHGRIYKEQFVPSDELSMRAINTMVNHFHNNFIDKLVISGVVGLALLLFLLCYPAYYGYRYERYKALLFMLPPIYFSLISMTDSPFRNGGIVSTYFVMMSVIFLLGRHDKAK